MSPTVCRFGLDLKAAKGTHKILFTHPSNDVDKLNSSDRVRRNQVAREHGRLPSLSRKKDVNNRGLQEAEPLSSFVTSQPIKRSWMNAAGEEHILQGATNDNESRRVFPIPAKYKSEIQRKAAIGKVHNRTKGN